MSSSAGSWMVEDTQVDEMDVEVLPTIDESIEKKVEHKVKTLAGSVEDKVDNTHNMTRSL